MDSLPVTEGVEYRKIDEWPGYAAGDDGSIWSCKKGKWNRLVCTVGSHGYETCRMAVACRDKLVRVHRIIFQAFNGEIKGGKVICHNDGNKRNNRLENLRADTHKANANDKRRHGTHLECDRHSMAKLSDKQALEILRRHADGEKQASLGREFGVTKHAIHLLVHRKTWAALAT